MPYFFSAVRIIWLVLEKCEMSKLALSRTRIPIGGLFEVPLWASCVAGQTWSPEVMSSVKRSAWLITPDWISSQRTSPGKIGSPAASAEVQSSGRRALLFRSHFVYGGAL